MGRFQNPSGTRVPPTQPANDKSTLRHHCVHIRDSQEEAEALKVRLGANPLYTTYYDGFEHTMDKVGGVPVVLTTRYYYQPVAIACC